MKKRKPFVMLALTFVSAWALLGGCGEVFSPNFKLMSDEERDKLTPVFERVTIPTGQNRVTVCCNPGNEDNIIDSSTTTMWGSWAMSQGSFRDSIEHRHIFFGPHLVTIDLGSVVENIARIQYIPAWTYGSGSWPNSPPAAPGVSAGSYYSNSNNGVCTSFEVYVTEFPLKPDEAGMNASPPPSSMVGKGQWYCLENGYNSKITSTAHEFFATFGSRRGRYVHFRILSSYNNSWEANAMLGNVADLRIWTTKKPSKVDMTGLREVLDQANFLASQFLPRYGYLNSILTNWGGRAEGFLADPTTGTQEMVDYVRDNIRNLVRMAGVRQGLSTYNRFVPKIYWADDNGNHMTAGGGGSMWDPVSQKWWWYGEDRRTNNSGGGQPGVHAYSSEDMYNWKDEGVAFPIFNNTVYDEPNWREASSVSPDGFPGGWDGSRNNDSGASPSGTPVYGFMWTVNKWRQSLGDWNSDGYIDPAGEYYPNGKLQSLTGANRNSLFETTPGTWADSLSVIPMVSVTDPDYIKNNKPAYLRGPLSKEVQDTLWNAIKDYIPEGNPPMYVYMDNKGKPYATAMGLDQAKVNELNAMYRDIPVWRRKQMYRYWNWTTTVERPKVIFNAGQGRYKVGTGTHALTGKPIRPYEDDTGVYPYVMFTHIEGGVVGISYGTAKVLVSVAKKPQGPFKMVWAYHIHFDEGLTYSTSHLGMTRDQSVMVDDDGTAYHFGSTQENRIVGIDMLDETYTRIVGVPQYPVGESQDQMIQEGYDNRKGRYYNFVNGNQREAPAPFLHYTDQNMTYEGLVNADGTLGALSTSRKLYFVASSTSTGWFTNAQGVYRTSTKNGRILGNAGQAKIDAGGTNPESYVTSNGSDPGTGANGGSGWVAIRGHENNGASGQNGATGTSSYLFGQADDGSYVNRGYDGQTTYVQQLRYPKFKWGIIGFRDYNYKEPVFGEDYGIADTDPLGEEAKLAYYAWLDGKFGAGSDQYRRPIYGQREIPEPRAGKLVWGKYIHMQDSWDSAKNYDARYIWLPMRVTDNTEVGTRPVGPNNENSNGPYGTRVRWMKEWRWEDFVYELGPFAKSMQDDPGRIVDSVGDSQSMWANSSANLQNLLDYYEMLNNCFGPSNDWYLNPGKQNFGQDWLSIQFPDIFGGL